MFKISIPVVCNTVQFDKEKTLLELQRAGAERIFLAIGEVPFHPEERAALIARLNEYVPYYRQHGLEVGVWIWSFVRKDPDHNTRGCQLRISPQGTPYGVDYIPPAPAYCPICPEFIADSQDFLREIAKTGPDIIQFDDDYSSSSSGSRPTRCYCSRHINRIQAVLGEEIDRETLYEKAFSGRPNRYRQAVLDVSGDGLREFSRAMRQAVDSINPNIRISLCSVMGSWDMDGSDALEQCTILAGNTKPIMRLINAPYWSTFHAWGNRLQHTIELGRMEFEWCRDQGIEIMSEGDVYPRPRYRVPASYLEGFDTGIRFAGVGDGILKYMLDYNSSPTYETGYVDRHVKHQALYQEIQNRFFHQPAVGVRVYNTMRKYAQADLTDTEDAFDYGWNLFFSRAARLLTDNTIPTTYTGPGCCGIVFGENARYLPEEALSQGLILDIRAARILMEQGIDVGIQSIGGTVQPQLNTSGCSSPQFLYYPAENEYTATGYSAKSTYEITPMPGAQVITTIRDGLRELADTILYTNAQGQKFMVYGFDAYFTGEDRYRSYCAQKQLIQAIRWLSSRPLPAVCPGHPDLYMQCKATEDSLSVGLWNFFADEIDVPTVTLDEEYSQIDCLNCTGHLNGNTVTLSALPPYGVVFFTVRK